MNRSKNLLVLALGAALFGSGCGDKTATAPSTAETTSSAVASSALMSAAPRDDDKFIGKPLVSHIYTADPSAHVFNDRVYIYPSHDIDSGITSTGEGDKFDMKDYHVFSIDKKAMEKSSLENGAEVTDRVLDMMRSILTGRS